MDNKELILKPDNSAIKFLYFADSHFTATSPKNRTDNLFEASIAKLGEIAGLCRQLEVDFVLHGGDFFDRPDVTDLVAGQVASLVKKAGVPFFVVPGGHDLYGNNIDSVRRTKLGLFKQAGLVELLIHPSVDRVLVKKGDLTLQLTGTGSHFGIDTENIEDDYVLTYRDADCAVHTVHGMLMPKRFIPGTPIVLVADIDYTAADITFTGHYHLGFKTVELGKRYFVNCGAMVRRKNDLKEIGRKPQVAVVTVSKRRSIEKIEYLPLQTAPEGEDVLDRAEILRKIQRKEKEKEYRENASQVQGMEAVDLHSVIEKISQNKACPPEVVQVALARIEKMQEIMGERGL